MVQKKRQRSHGGKSFGGKKPLVAQAKQLERQTDIYIDVDALPKDLDEEQLEDLLAERKKPKGRAKVQEIEYVSWCELKLGELIERAEDEKLEIPVTRRRRDILWRFAENHFDKGGRLQSEGCLEVIGDDIAFLRIPSASYLPTEEDVFVPRSMIERFGLRTGMTLRGEVRPPLEGERHLCLCSLELVDLHDPEEAASRTPFKELTPLYPEERFLLEGTSANPLEMRIADLVTPIGRGQRGLIVAPPRTGKTVLLQQIANSIVEKAPDCHLIVLLIDERPEEVTDFERNLAGNKREVISSTFDESSARHLKVARMVIEKARSLVEAGEDVVILLDSITRLARASNQEAPSDGKLLSGGIEATALSMPKQFFGSARNIEDGGSLTILGTALIETGSKMDEVIFEEFKGTGNMELVLERRLADRRIFPAIDINRSGTRKEELLFTPQEIERVWMLRKVLNELDPVEAMEMLVQKMRRTKVNAEFLMTIGS